MYPDADARRAKHPNTSDPVLAMHLWNDWNTQLLEWEKAHASDEDFDFLVMGSEDLLDPEKKFESLVRMAEFVGSSVTMEKLCCMSRESVVDMGQSVGFDETAGQKGSGVGWHRNSGSFKRDDNTEFMRQMKEMIGKRRQHFQDRLDRRERNSQLSIDRKRLHERLHVDKQPEESKNIRNATNGSTPKVAQAAQGQA